MVVFPPQNHNVIKNVNMGCSSLHVDLVAGVKKTLNRNR